MAQMTENMVADMLAACERLEHPPLTVWETKQLLHAWREREALRKDAERYRWLRTAGAWESEIGMDVLSAEPASFDAAVDIEMAAKPDVGAA